MPVKSRFSSNLRGLVLLLGWLVAGAACAQGPAPERPTGWTPKKPVVSKHDMVAAANPLAVEAGYAALREGGNAIDAAVAVQMILNLVEPQSSGIGGGAFLVYWSNADHRVTSFDGRETAPAAAASAGRRPGWRR